MSVFNSLGSNYSSAQRWLALQSLFVAPKNLQSQVSSQINQSYPGNIYYTYKGRDAITLCLKSLGIKSGDQVLTQALACSAVESAIVRAGGQPKYLDLRTKSLKMALPESTQAKALIVQHLFGYPDDLDTIQTWCQQHQVLLIHDLAQAFGIKLQLPVDGITLSFGRDKIIDGVSGGAFISKALPTLPPNRVSTLIKIQDLSYPFLSSLVRFTHDYLVGKVIHRLLTLSHWWYSPTLSPLKEISSLPASYFPLIHSQLSKLDQSINHRRTLAQYYFDHLPPATRLVTQDQISAGVCLRYPINIADLPSFIYHLRSANIYLEDRWYRQPVDSGKIGFNSTYVSGSCPNAESLAQHILNLPTHQYINLATAAKICQTIKQETSSW